MDCIIIRAYRTAWWGSDHIGSPNHTKLAAAVASAKIVAAVVSSARADRRHAATVGQWDNVVREATAAYLAAEDAIAQWLEECCGTDASYQDRSTALYASWKGNEGEVWGRACDGFTESRDG